MLAEFGPGYKRIKANKAYLRFIGKSLEEWIASPDTMDVIAVEHRKMAWQAHDRLAHEKEQANVIDMVDAAGTKRPVAWYNKATFDAKGKIIKIICRGEILKD